MSPTRRRAKRSPGGFPRVSGDEPQVSDVYKRSDQFSPRERG